MPPGRPRKTLPMSDEEIRREYRLAKNPAKQIKILADENSCDVKTIRRIVAEADAPSSVTCGDSFPQGKPTVDLSGFVPFQEAAEQEKKKEKDNMPEDESIPLRVSADGELPSETPTWQPLPSAPPQAAADFPEEDAAGDEGRIATAARPPRNDEKASSLPDVQDLPGVVTGRLVKPLTVERERRFFLTEDQVMELWFILGQLRGVLDASAEAGKPGEVMKDAVAELESLLRSLN